MSLAVSYVYVLWVQKGFLKFGFTEVALFTEK